VTYKQQQMLFVFNSAVMFGLFVKYGISARRSNAELEGFHKV